MPDLGIAVWGLGTHAVKSILPAIRICSGVSLKGVCSRDYRVLSRVASDFECKGWRTPEEMLDDPTVDAVYLSTPIALHIAQGRLVLQADKHLWCEKPIGASAGEVTSLLEFSRARGLTIGEGFMYLYHPQFLQLRDILTSGRLGKIRSVSCRFGIPPLERPGFRTDPALGGGAFLDVGAYPISTVVALFPYSEPEILLAEISGAEASPVDVEGRAVLGYGDGIRATLEWGINCAYRNEIDVWGTHGSMSTERLFSKTEDHVPRFDFRDLHGNVHTEEGSTGNHFTAMIGAFCGLVDDPGGAEQERVQIARRATLAEAIRQKSTT